MSRRDGHPVEDPSIDAEEAACRLLLHWQAAAAGSQEGAKADLPALPSLAGVIADGPQLEAAREWLVGREAALFLAIDGPFDARATCDGAVVGHDADPDAIRRRLGAACILGARCGTSRHAAMVAGERGADYILFGHEDGAANVEEIVEILRWWRDLFVLPAAVVGIRSIEDARAFRGEGADFLLPARGQASPLIVAIDRMLAA